MLQVDACTSVPSWELPGILTRPLSKNILPSVIPKVAARGEAQGVQGAPCRNAGPQDTLTPDACRLWGNTEKLLATAGPRPAASSGAGSAQHRLHLRCELPATKAPLSSSSERCRDTGEE